MQYLKDSIIETISIIDNNSTLFYQQKNEEGFQELEHTLSSIMSTVNKIFTFQLDKKIILLEEQILNVVLSEAMKSIEQKDTILLADILYYEVRDVLGECLNKLEVLN